MSNLLDVEIGKSIGVRRTKGGAGDKEEAFLIRGNIFKGALLCCLMIAVVGGLAIFISQWEVSFQRRINIMERSEHAEEEQQSYNRLMEVGNFLANFLRTETNERLEASLVRDLVQSHVDELLKEIDKSESPQHVQALVDKFGSTIYQVLSEYSGQIESESAAAKDLLQQINSILADEEFMPHHRNGEDEDMQHARIPKRQDRHDARRNERPVIGDSLGKVLRRFFDRFNMLKSLEIPSDIAYALEDMLKEIQTRQFTSEQEVMQYFDQVSGRVKALLTRPGVKGIDVAMILPGRAIVGTLHEILGAYKVKQNPQQVQAIHDQWVSGRFSDGEIMHELHRLSRQRIVPFDWVVGDNVLRRGKGARRPRNRANAFSFADTKNLWWKGLAEKEGRGGNVDLPFGLKFPFANKQAQ